MERRAKRKRQRRRNARRSESFRRPAKRLLPHDFESSEKMKKQLLQISGRGCGHCHRRVELLLSEETCPETYCCSMCRARWMFCDVEVCVGCQESISVSAAFGDFGESEPEGVLIEGAPYCWGCAEEVMR